MSLDFLDCWKALVWMLFLKISSKNGFQKSGRSIYMESLHARTPTRPFLRVREGCKSLNHSDLDTFTFVQSASHRGRACGIIYRAGSCGRGRVGVG